MYYWMYFTIASFIIPLLSLFLGKFYFIKIAKKDKICGGYKTPSAARNIYTWTYGNNFFGTVLYLGGMVFVPWAVVADLAALDIVVSNMQKAESVANENLWTTVIIGCLIGLQVIFLIGAVIGTEIYLKKKFDENGNLISGQNNKGGKF